MRRIASSLVASCAIATLAACGGSGFGTSSSTVPTSDQVLNGSGQANDFTVSPVGTLPLQMSATGQTGTGSNVTVVPFATFTWQAGYAPAGASFLRGPSPLGNTPCGTPSEKPAVPVLQAGPGGNTYPLYGGAYSILPPAQTATNVYIGVPLDPRTGAPVLPATGSTNYCLVVDEANASGQVIGSQTVVVTNAAP